jgi:hypothetical protein
MKNLPVLPHATTAKGAEDAPSRPDSSSKRRRVQLIFEATVASYIHEISLRHRDVSVHASA